MGEAANMWEQQILKNLPFLLSFAANLNCGDSNCKHQVALQLKQIPVSGALRKCKGHGRVEEDKVSHFHH